MELELTGLRAFVTGSNSGIGEGIAKRLAREGAKVAIHGRNVERLEKVAAELRADGAEVIMVRGDLAEEADCTRVSDEIMAAWGGIDILVNNSGGRAASNLQDGIERSQAPGWMDTPWEDWRWTYEQNIGAAVRLIRAFAPGMIERGFGRIINIGSISATQPPPDHADYCPAKAAMTNMTSGLSKTLGGTGVTVNTVTPGTILTPAVEKVFRAWAADLNWQTDDWSEIERRFTTELMPQTIKRFGRPDDIARMVALVASPLSSFMTGTNYRVDGGFCHAIN